MKTILVAGGAGYIGSHMVALLVKRGYEVVVADNLRTGHWQSVKGARRLHCNAFCCICANKCQIILLRSCKCCKVLQQGTVCFLCTQNSSYSGSCITVFKRITNGSVCLQSC